MGFCSATALQSVEIACDTLLSGKAKVMISGGLDDISEGGSHQQQRDSICNGSRAHRDVWTCYYNPCWLRGVPGNWCPHPHVCEDCPRTWYTHPRLHRIHVYFHVSSSLSTHFDIVLVLPMSQRQVGCLGISEEKRSISKSGFLQS